MTATTTVTPAAIVFPYSGLSDPARVVTQAPRGEVRYSSINASIDAGDAGGQIVNYAISLPPNFAYALLDCFFMVRQTVAGTANNFDLVAYGTINDDQSGALDTYNVPVEFEAKGQGQDAGGRILNSYTVHGQYPKLTLVPQPGKQASLTITARNTTASETDYDTTFFARFMSYQIDQAFHFEVNLPQLVR